MTIDLRNAAKYYKGLPHQKQAFSWLQSLLTVSELETFASFYRSGPSTFIERIQARLNELKIDLYKEGSQGYGFTIIGVEGVDPDLTPNGNILDKWNDICFGVKAYPDGKLVVAGGPYICTTEPGKYYTQDRLLNPLGAANVRLDIKHNAIWVLGKHKNQSNCLIQLGNKVEVVRDSDKDGIRDDNEPRQKDFLGINFHHTNGNYNPNSIGRHSAGCLVLPNTQEHQTIVNEFKKSKQRAVSYILLDGGKI